MHQVDAPTRAALSNAEMTHSRVRITEKLPGDLWRAVATVLTKMRGRYELNESAFAFTYDPRPMVRDVIATGMCKVVEDEGYAPTPSGLAEELTTEPFSDLARMPAGSRVLEPSAGDGRLVQAILDVNDEIEVVAVEPNEERAALIGEHGGRVTVVGSMFEEYAAGPGAGEKFDAVVMNPPFAVPGKKSIWLDHVMIAWNMLEPGGRLVSVVPGGFSYRNDRRHLDMRELVKQFGGSVKLPTDTFGNGFQTYVIWMARPVPGQEGCPSWLFRHYAEAVEPVPVKYPWLTSRAVQEAPVQVWKDHAPGGLDRVLRYRAQCWRCGWLLWQFDGNNDMALGNHATNNCLEAYEEGKVGLTVGLCMACETQETYHAAMKVAHEVWSKPPTKAAALSLWEQLLAQGGMLPVSGAERERHAKVQAAMRVVFGLPEYAEEAELIDVRQAWRGGPDRLAAQYLREYADRLDPEADLDHLDLWALQWRSDPDAPAVALPEPADPWIAVFEQMALLGPS